MIVIIILLLYLLLLLRLIGRSEEGNEIFLRPLASVQEKKEEEVGSPKTLLRTREEKGGELGKGKSWNSSVCSSQDSINGFPPTPAALVYGCSCNYGCGCHVDIFFLSLLSFWFFFFFIFFKQDLGAGCVSRIVEDGQLIFLENNEGTSASARRLRDGAQLSLLHQPISAEVSGVVRRSNCGYKHEIFEDFTWPDKTVLRLLVRGNVRRDSGGRSLACNGTVQMLGGHDGCEEIREWNRGQSKSGCEMLMVIRRSGYRR